MVPRVLIVEDNDQVRQLLVAFLELDAYRVIEAADGCEGLAAAQREQPDLIVTDIMMPEMDGWTMVRHLRQLDLCRDIPVLFISGLKQPPGELDESLGRVDYIAKPVTLDSFLGRVRNLLACA